MEEIWQNLLLVVKEILTKANIKNTDVISLGITNQRETVVFWDKANGQPLSRAIVWQCRRTASYCKDLAEKGYGEMVKSKTGLVIDPYFSGTKIRWVLDNDKVIRGYADRGELACGTVDSYLLYRLSGGKVFATDYSNASRTMLFNIHLLEWDKDLTGMLQVPEAILPEVRASSCLFGETDPDNFLGLKIPIGGVAGDQQAALFGQACFHPGMTKNTYGTGSFLLMNTGEKAVVSDSGLLTTIAWGIDNRIEYALEGSIFVTGAAVQWLRDGLKIIAEAAELEPLARQIEDNEGVFLVPAFAGLGAPYWDPYARGLLIGITGGTSRSHLARAVIEAMAYQSRDILDIMRKESGLPLGELRVDGGASVMDLLLQFQADIVSTTVRRAATSDTTSLGAAYLAGLAVNLWKDSEELASLWEESASFQPVMDDKKKDYLYSRWLDAVKRSLDWTG